MDKKVIEEQLKNFNIVNIQEKPKKICPVCGHANDRDSGMCEMCSTYLN